MTPGRPRILVSGGTGFLGDAVRPLLEAFADVTLISRKQPGCLRADLAKWDGGLAPETLRGKFDVFLHMAGLYDLRATKREAHTQNVVGTHTALTITQKAEIPHFVHISTVAVAMSAGTAPIARTDQLESLRTFPDAYSETKAAAEQMVRTWSSPHLRSRLILRPGVLVGDQREGKIHRIDGPYHAAEGLRKLLRIASLLPGPLPLPGRADRFMPIVPVDVAADAIARLVELAWGDQWEGLRCLHLAPAKGLSSQELYTSTLRHLGHEGQEFILMSRLPDWLVKPAAELLVRFPQEELEYLLNFPRYDTRETEAILGANWCPEFRDFEKEFWRGYEAFVSHR
ncbi:MAG: SDR family oxidoreductase [Bdellovibrionaceae bacterium]|nr:SDR family oxidoreductase [Pseudobdellovibrionaceae bacterium]